MPKPFPDQEFYKKRYFGQNVDDFLGCWEIDVARKIAKELRKDGFSVNIRPRGHRKIKATESIKKSQCTHGALYIRNAVDVVTLVNPRIAGLTMDF